MQITNGSVSRVYKPGDYEGRTINLSFTLDPGDNPEQCVADVAGMAERRARDAYTAYLAGGAVPPTPPAPVPATRSRKAGSSPATNTATAPSDPASAPVSGTVSELVADPFGANAAQDTSAASATGASPPASSVDASDPRLTNDGMRAAITRKVDTAPDRTAISAGIRDLVASYTGDRISPIYTVEDPAKRAEFLDKLAAL